MVDLDILEGIFRKLDGYLANLRALAHLPKSELLTDLARLGGAKYYLQAYLQTPGVTGGTVGSNVG